eukprot:RCo053840
MSTAALKLLRRLPGPDVREGSSSASRAALVLVDGPFVPPLLQRKGGAEGVTVTAVKGGDGLCFSIAAASVLAKVTRDRLMQCYHKRWPAYNFAKHKGYPTAEHIAALRKLGPCPIHRLTFGPVRAAVSK